MAFTLSQIISFQPPISKVYAYLPFFPFYSFLNLPKSNLYHYCYTKYCQSEKWILKLPGQFHLWSYWILCLNCILFKEALLKVNWRLLQRLRIVKIQASVDTSPTYFLYLRFGEYGGRGDRKIVTTRGQGRMLYGCVS